MQKLKKGNFFQCVKWDLIENLRLSWFLYHELHEVRDSDLSMFSPVP